MPILFERILLKQDLLKLVGCQEDWVCQHEVVQECFCRKRGRKNSIQNVRYKGSQLWKQEVHTKNFSGKNIINHAGYIHVSSLPDLLDRS